MEKELFPAIKLFHRALTKKVIIVDNSIVSNYNQQISLIIFILKFQS